MVGRIRRDTTITTILPTITFLSLSYLIYIFLNFKVRRQYNGDKPRTLFSYSLFVHSFRTLFILSFRTLFSYSIFVLSFHTLFSVSLFILSFRTLFSYSLSVLSFRHLFSYTLLVLSFHTLFSYSLFIHSFRFLFSCSLFVLFFELSFREPNLFFQGYSSFPVEACKCKHRPINSLGLPLFIELESIARLIPLVRRFQAGNGRHDTMQSTKTKAFTLVTLLASQSRHQRPLH